MSTEVSTGVPAYAPGQGLRIGVLALQGDVPEHLAALERQAVTAVPVRRRAELDAVAALVIPGGESTAISKLLDYFALLDPLRERLAAATEARVAIPEASDVEAVTGHGIRARVGADRIAIKTGHVDGGLRDLSHNPLVAGTLHAAAMSRHSLVECFHPRQHTLCGSLILSLSSPYLRVKNAVTMNRRKNACTDEAADP